MKIWKRAWSAGALALAWEAVGCVGSADDPARVGQGALAACPPEPTTPDADGRPRNAAGDVRYCWPEEPGCSCDADGDCYAGPGLVPCAATAGANDTCARAAPVGDTFDLYGQPVETARETSTACAAEQSAPLLYYRASVPPASTLRVEASGARRPAFLRLLGGCDATSCLASGASAAEYTNTGTAAREVVIAVGQRPEDGAFDLHVALDPVATDASCATPTALADGAVLADQDLAGGARGPTACTPSGTGPTRYYTATVPPGAQLTVAAELATPAPVDAVDVYLLDGCGAGARCLAYTPPAFPPPGPAGLSWTNTGTAPRTVLVGIGTAATTSSVPTFTLRARIAPVPYAASYAPRACDDMTWARAVRAFGGPSGGGDAQWLPFAFTLAGARVERYAALHQGVLVFGGARAALGEIYDPARNRPVPDPSLPQGLVAPFWDDLLLGGSGIYAGAVRVQTFGAPPSRHVTIEWRDAAVRSGPAGSAGTFGRATFQAKLFEGSHAIEFHYCALVPGTASPGAVFGASATVGVESLDGLRGYQHAFQTPGAVDTARAVVLRPQR